MLNVGLIIGGMVALAIAIWGRTFYAADIEGGSVNDENPIPRWLGRLLFAIVGIGFLFIGIMKLLDH